MFWLRFAPACRDEALEKKHLGFRGEKKNFFLKTGNKGEHLPGFHKC